LPELLPANYPGLVPIQNPAAISAAILLLLETHDGEGFRERFLKFYTLDRYLSELAKAFESLG
jgi:glycosyltransferase involved in cell wall biosynthesis